MDFQGRDIVSIGDLNREEIEYVMDVAGKMMPVARGEKTTSLMNGKILGTVFFEPSTRTHLSFTSAMQRLGGSVLGFSGTTGTSVVKGETLADTIRMVESYCDIIVVRHPQEGAARLAAEFSEKPIINAGDGAGQHPTQTLLDLFTIKTEMSKIEGNNIVLVGDLKYGRTVHSLSYALSKFGVSLTMVAPEVLQMPGEIIGDIKDAGTEVKQMTSLEEAIPDADVIYVTRIQKERFPDPAEYQKVAGLYTVNLDLMRDAKEKAIIMHPLPRVTEISPEVDNTNHAVYFRQAFNGVPVRMALLALVSGADLGGL